MVHLSMCDGMQGSENEHVWSSGTLETPCLEFGHRLVTLIWSQDHGMWKLGGPQDRWPIPHQFSARVTETCPRPLAQKEASLDLPP